MDSGINHQHHTPRKSAVVIAAIFAAGVLVLSLIAIAAWWVLGGPSIGTPRTVEVIVASTPGVNPVEATDELCAELGCIEGWRTDIGNFLRFDAAGKAEYWEEVLGDDARRNNAILLDLRGIELTLEDQRLAIDTLFGDRDWY